MRDSLGVTGDHVRIPALVIALVMLHAPARAQTGPQTVVVKGLQMWSSGHCRDAIDAWTSSWSGQDAFQRTQLVNGCDLLEQMGTIEGYDILRTVDITPHLQRVYVLLRYEKQPVYLLVAAYESKDDWKIVTVNWNTDPDKVVPSELLLPQHVGP